MIARTLLILVVGWGSLGAGSQEVPRTHPSSVQYDSTEVIVRQPASDALAAYRDNEAFQYNAGKEEAYSVGDDLWQWISQNILDPALSREMEPVRRFIFYALIVAALIFAVSRLLRMEIRSLWSGPSQRHDVTFETAPTDLEAVDLLALIEEALAKHDYRRAVRLYYLKAIQELSARDLIHWQQNKTNHAYLGELATPALRPAFARLTFLFDYIWYGDFPVDAQALSQVRHAFDQLYQALPGNGS